MEIFYWGAKQSSERCKSIYLPSCIPACQKREVKGVVKGVPYGSLIQNENELRSHWQLFFNVQEFESAGSFLLWQHTGSAYLLPTTLCFHWRLLPELQFPLINNFAFIKICGDSRQGWCELNQGIWRRVILKSEDLKSVNSDPKSNEINTGNLKFQGTSISTPLTLATQW